MNAYELADELKACVDDGSTDLVCVCGAVNMLREQADRIVKYEQVLQSIANEQVELSHDKIKWQCEDHIRWAKEVLK